MRWCLAVALTLWLARDAVAGQDRLAADEPSVQAFLTQLESLVLQPSRPGWRSLVSEVTDGEVLGDRLMQLTPPGATRVVARERDHQPLGGALPGDGYQLVIDIFVESDDGRRGQILTWALDIRRPRGDDDPQPWRIVTVEQVGLVDGLFQLALDESSAFQVEDFSVQGVDLELRLQKGHVMVVPTPEGITGLVLMGEGTMRFAPAPKHEQGQLRIFSGAPALESAFTLAFVRLHPLAAEALQRQLEPGRQVAVQALRRRAHDVFIEEVGRSYSLDLSDLSRSTWSLLPQPGDMVAEVRTRRHGRLTYARTRAESEDVTLFQRDRERTVAQYASPEQLERRGRFYDESEFADVDLTDIQLEASFDPEREWLEGRARLRLTTRAPGLTSLRLKLADTLTVTDVHSPELGRLLFLRVRDQQSIVVNLPATLPSGTALTLDIAYRGVLRRQTLHDESAAVTQGGGSQSGAGQGTGRQADPLSDLMVQQPERYWLLSNRSGWYPQAPVSDYATATMHVSVPAGYEVVGSGRQPLGSPDQRPAASRGQLGTRRYTFTAAQPVRYLSLAISALARADAATVLLDGVDALGQTQETAETQQVPRLNTLEVTVDATPQLMSRGRAIMEDVADVVQYYSSIFGDMPYESVALGLLEDALPGGHAPGYAVLISYPPPMAPVTWRTDPATFTSFPEFFLAHELAHQWFGQAVGWKNYHEQWLSEGMAQYLAGLFARERHGDRVFGDVVTQWQRTSLAASGEGPIYLGYRLGHLRREPRVFRALVYNKGAAVLHMLRHWIGDEAFFRGWRDFYMGHRYRKAGSDDLRRAFEAASGVDLVRFFERWVYDDLVPDVEYAVSHAPQAVTLRFEQRSPVTDVPVTVHLRLPGGETKVHLVRLDQARQEVTLPAPGPVREVRVNPDRMALARFSPMRTPAR